MISTEELRKAFIEASMIPKEYFEIDHTKISTINQREIIKFENFIKKLRGY